MPDHLTPAGYADRLLLAMEAVHLQWERRNQYLSDDDVLNVADQWTTSQWYPDGVVDDADYCELRDTLFDRIVDATRILDDEPGHPSEGKDL